MDAELGELFEPLLSEMNKKLDATKGSQDKINALLEENKEALSDVALRYIARHDGLRQTLTIQRLGALLDEQGIPVYGGFVSGLLKHLSNEGLIRIPRIEYARGERDYFVQLTGKAKLREDVKEIKSEIRYGKDKKAVESVLGMTKGYGLVPETDSVDELIPLIEEGYLRILTEEGVELLYRAYGEPPSLKTIKIIDV